MNEMGIISDDCLQLHSKFVWVSIQSHLRNALIPQIRSPIRNYVMNYMFDGVNGYGSGAVRASIHREITHE